MTPRTLFLDHTAQLGGGEFSLLDTAHHLRSSCTVLLFSDGPFHEALRARGVEVELLPGSAPLMAVRRDESGLSLSAGAALLALGRAVARRARRYDVLYANSQKAFMIAAIAGRLAGRPVIWHLRDILSRDHFGLVNVRAAVLLANLLAARIIANSRATTDAFARAGGRAGKVEIVYNGIDPAPFEAVTDADVGAVRAELGIGAAPLVGMFGRFHLWKGQHVVVEALAGLPDVHAVFVGDALFGEGAYVEQVRARARELGITGRLHFVGFREDIPRLMRAVDVVVHASVAPEPFGRVIVEAMLARRPVVASRGGGVSEIVVEGVTGELVAPGNPTVLADALLGLLARPNRRQAMGLAGYERARRLFGLETMLLAITRQIETICRPKAPLG